MDNPAQPLLDMRKENEFLVCIDSDGCAFDTMEITHKECFIPNTIDVWELQPVAKYARETAEFINLYSKWRGANRFAALINILETLEEREEVKKRGYRIPDINSLRQWVINGTRLENSALEDIVRQTGDPVLSRTLKWSQVVDDAIAKIVRNVPPFPYVRESLELISECADIVVVSTKPGEALKREWEEHGLARFIKIIAGQEMGTKKECLECAKKGRYLDENVLMIGDAPGDLKAARDNNMPFYPINPGREEISWKKFYEEAFDRFIKGEYAGVYEQKLITEFDQCLPSVPRWKKNRLTLEDTGVAL